MPFRGKKPRFWVGNGVKIQLDLKSAIRRVFQSGIKILKISISKKK